MGTGAKMRLGTSRNGGLTVTIAFPRSIRKATAALTWVGVLPVGLCWPGATAAQTLTVFIATHAPAMAPAIAESETLNPDIRIAYQEYQTVALHAAMLAGAAPDVVMSSALDLQVDLVNCGLARRLDILEADALPDRAMGQSELFGFTSEPPVMAYNRASFAPGQPSDRTSRTLWLHPRERRTIEQAHRHLRFAWVRHRLSLRVPRCGTGRPSPADHRNSRSERRPHILLHNGYDRGDHVRRFRDRHQCHRVLCAVARGGGPARGHSFLLRLQLGHGPQRLCPGPGPAPRGGRTVRAVPAIGIRSTRHRHLITALAHTARGRRQQFDPSAPASPNEQLSADTARSGFVDVSGHIEKEELFGGVGGVRLGLALISMRCRFAVRCAPSTPTELRAARRKPAITSAFSRA